MNTGAWGGVSQRPVEAPQVGLVSREGVEIDGPLTPGTLRCVSGYGHRVQGEDAGQRDQGRIHPDI